jgi:hypothetical protein
MAPTFYGIEGLMADLIVTAREYHGVQTPAAFHALLMRDDGLMARRLGVDPASVGGPERADGGAPPAIARVYEGWWIADCPNPDCAGARFIMRGCGFMCGSCFNADAGRRYRPVEWPAREREIEVALLARPTPANRNWSPGETVGDLERENAENGMGA